MSNKHHLPDELAKVPPQSVELEESVLGAILLEPKSIHVVYKQLESNQFYKENHQLIYQAIMDLLAASSAIDILTVTQHLRSKGELDLVGGAHYISYLTNRVSSSANIEYHMRVIQQQWMKREVIKISSEAIRSGFEDDTDVFELVDKVVSESYQITRNVTDRDNHDLNYMLDEIEQRIVDRSKGIIPGLKTGCEKYDNNSGGQQKAELIVYAGRPGMGKSARMCNEAYHQIKEGKKVIIHSLDMPGTLTLARLISLHLDKPIKDVSHGKIPLKEYQQAKEFFKKSGLKICESFKLTNIMIESKMYQLMNGCDIVYVDYLQQIQTDARKNDYQRVSEASLAMKILAKEMNVPVVALAQLSRAVETRGGDKIPILSDLRESGQIEQDADVIEFLYRPEYYDITEDAEGNSLVGQCHYINAKFRNGDPNNVIIMGWNGPTNKLSNWADGNSHFSKPDPFKHIDVDYSDDNPF